MSTWEFINAIIISSNVRQIRVESHQLQKDSLLKDGIILPVPKSAPAPAAVSNIRSHGIICDLFQQPAPAKTAAAKSATKPKAKTKKAESSDDDGDGIDDEPVPKANNQPPVKVEVVSDDEDVIPVPAPTAVRGRGRGTGAATAITTKPSTAGRGRGKAASALAGQKQIASLMNQSQLSFATTAQHVDTTLEVFGRQSTHLRAYGTNIGIPAHSGTETDTVHANRTICPEAKVIVRRSAVLLNYI